MLQGDLVLQRPHPEKVSEAIAAGSSARQREGKRAAYPFGALHPDLSSLLFDDLGGQIARRPLAPVHRWQRMSDAGAGFPLRSLWHPANHQSDAPGGHVARRASAHGGGPSPCPLAQAYIAHYNGPSNALPVS
jgi:hypothetical protein